jgi:glucose/arabinose dehydrogenase
MKRILLLGIAYCITNFTAAQPIIGFTEVANGLTNPVDVANANDGSNRLFIVEQGGTVRIFDGSTILPTPFLDVSSLISGGGERGLLSIAFHPQYASNRYFFIYYTNTAGDITVAQYRTDAGTPDVADPSSGKVLLTIPKPFANHNGGKLNFGPDGNLYFGTGDGGSGGDPNNNAQTGTSDLGKLIRINVDDFTTPPYYTIPPTNPFIGDPAINDEIFALGLRNPWRWSFDKLTGDMWIADVGQGAWEEVNYRTQANMSGVNYGWRCLEGTHDYDLSLCSLPLANYVPPIFEYPHDGATGGFVVTGGYVYRGTEFMPLQGYYICCDYATTNGWLIKDDGGGVFSSRRQNNFPANVSSFGEAEDGTLYTLSTTGSLSKIILSGVLPLHLLSFTALPQNGKDLLQWRVSGSTELSHFEIERSSDGVTFQTIGTITAQAGTTNYQFNIALTNTTTRFYRLKLLLNDGSIQYSGIVSLNTNFNKKISVRYNGAQQLQVFTPVPLKQLRIVNNMGQVIKVYTGISSGSQYLATGNLLPGIYWVQCFGDNSVENFKVPVMNP